MSGTGSITKDQIIDQLKSRAKDLLEQLQGYNAIQEEFKTISRAIKVLTGETVGPGRPEGSMTITPGQMKMLQLVKDGLRTAEQMGKRMRVGEHNYQMYGRKLLVAGYLKEAAEKGISSSTGRSIMGYELTDAGAELLEGGDQELAPLPVRTGKPTSVTRPGGNHRAAKSDINAATMLPVLAQYPHGLNTADLVEKMGHEPDRANKTKVGIMVCYWRQKKFLATNKKDGTHTLTPAGKQRVAEILAES
jgi:hypothetical protein